MSEIHFERRTSNQQQKSMDESKIVKSPKHNISIPEKKSSIQNQVASSMSYYEEKTVSLCRIVELICHFHLLLYYSNDMSF